MGEEGDLRQRMQTAMELEMLSLRKLGDATGISFATLSRFNRGKDMTAQNCRRLDAWLKGEELAGATPIHSRRFNVGSQRFLVTIHLLNENEITREGDSD